MEDGGSGVKIEMLPDGNYHAWKENILVVMPLKGLDHYLTKNALSNKTGQDGSEKQKKT